MYNIHYILYILYMCIYNMRTQLCIYVYYICVYIIYVYILYMCIYNMRTQLCIYVSIGERKTAFSQDCSSSILAGFCSSMLCLQHLATIPQRFGKGMKPANQNLDC